MFLNSKHSPLHLFILYHTLLKKARFYLTPIKYFFGFRERSTKSSTTSRSLPEVDLPNETTSTCTPLVCKYSTSGIKSPSPETITTESSRVDILMASTARPTSQSAFLAPPAKT